METRSSYHESIVKTYGFKVTADLSLAELEISSARLIDWAECFQEMGRSGVPFEMVLVQSEGDETLRVLLICSRKWEKTVISRLATVVREEAGERLAGGSPVELLNFFGPHFGDRPGIAEAVFRQLNQHHMDVIASGFSAASVYLVLPKGMALKVKNIFLKIFNSP